MSNGVTISIFLDTRRPKKSGKYPVKLRAFVQSPRQQKLYPLDFEFNEDEFKKIWETSKPKKAFKEDRMKLQTIQGNANEIVKTIKPFSFVTFERIFFDTNNKNRNDVGFYYEQAIKSYHKNDQIGTASNYDLSLKSLLKFYGKESLPVNVITPEWLESYEKHMIKDNKRSQTTVGFYLRPLRAIFNTAIVEKVVSQDSYPFGKRKYTIPAPKSVKKALSKEQLSMLYKCEAKIPEQEKARAFWFFSYSCNGMNFKDIVTLKYKDLQGDTLTFKRAKTQRTNKAQAPSLVFLNDFTKAVIDKYGNSGKKPDQYIFDVIDAADSAIEIQRKANNFIRYVNQHVKNLANSAGIKENISTYWARHSFATNAIRQGASMEFVSEALKHTNLNTTKGYFAGFEDEKKREINTLLMEF